ncbi:hypothetical protein OY10_004581 [Salmonella enterica subsp. enterica serovar Havana]|nr:hypothetical protein [Salmonella enterica subsp. enterica serovar Havana]EDV6712218.1 hypothetical protein [Salmonella enterica subsp. enterica serovar Havana]
MPVTTPLTRTARLSSGWRLHAASRHNDHRALMMKITLWKRPEGLFRHLH